jgi:hypothetical protein
MPDSQRIVRLAVLLTLCCQTEIPRVLERASAEESTDAFRLNERNTEVPFAFKPGGQRSWPISQGQRTAQDRVSLTIVGEANAKPGSEIHYHDLTISVTADGRLQLESADPDSQAELQLQLQHKDVNGAVTEQTIGIRPAPPSRPLTYLADFGDDIIRIFGTSRNQYREITKDGFDQYFRRLQCQGISRLIVWQSPFPYITDPQNFSGDDWSAYERQARAILTNDELTSGIQNRSGFSAYGWIRQLMALRLMPQLGEMISQSAQEHGIKLTASFRPFEAALTKYYVVPAFDIDGRYLWGFQPLCSPSVNYHPEDTGFAHYREILRQEGRSEFADVATITLPGVPNAKSIEERADAGFEDLQILPTPFPPLDGESFVLVRQVDGQFELQRWRDLRPKALARLQPLSDLQLAVQDDHLVISNIALPDDCQYLWISQPKSSTTEFFVSTATPVKLHAAVGNRLGVENAFIALHDVDNEADPTRVSGIPPDGHYHGEFQATDASRKHFLAGPLLTSLSEKQLVVSLGPRYSVEMMDFTQQAARSVAVRQLRTVMQLPAFDEIIINTRSHTQLAGYLGDDGESVRPLAESYREGARNVWQIGLDKAYAPRSAAELEMIKELIADRSTVEQITTVQPGTWRAVTCQSPEVSPWRFARNRLVADGVRQLLLDLRREFPDTRIQAVIPPTAETIDRVQAALDELRSANGEPFGRDYYRRLWCSNNHIPTIGEGMAMVDLSGTNVEPVFLGTGGYTQEEGTLKAYVDECTRDLANNRNSSFRGPRSYFFEAQGSLRATDQQAARRNREAVICELLRREQDISEVILYEAADWTYFLPLSDPDLSGHGFLDRRDLIRFDNE